MTFLSKKNYTFLFCLLGIAYIPGLFLPLMDKLPVHLPENSGSYLNTPYLFLWLVAVSYKMFGVTIAAYKIPSFLFSVLGVYSTYRLGKSLYNKETGRLAALVLASSFCYLWTNGRMQADTMLSAAIVFSLWQMLDILLFNKHVNIVGAAAGLAIAFSLKGITGILLPVAAFLIYLGYRKKRREVFSWTWLLVIALFLLFISPVAYCYYQQFTQHPEPMMRSTGDRMVEGFMAGDRLFHRAVWNDISAKSYFIFVFSFSWVCVPWGILFFCFLYRYLQQLFSRKQQWLIITVSLIVLTAFVVSVYRWLQYYHILFPLAAVMVSAFLLRQTFSYRWQVFIFTVQLFSSCVIAIIVIIVNGWIFPLGSAWHLYVILSLLLLLTLFIRSGFPLLQQSVLISVATMIILFFTVNTNISLWHSVPVSSSGFNRNKKVIKPTSALRQLADKNPVTPSNSP